MGRDAPARAGLAAGRSRRWRNARSRRAIEVDYGALLEAFDVNPLIPNGETSRQIMHELLIAHERYLPQFADVIAKLKADGVTIKDQTLRQFTTEGR